MAILEKGRIRQIETPEEIYDSPASVYVAKLLGSPVMNILAATRQGGFVAAADGAIRIAESVPPGDTAEIGLRPEDIKVHPWTEESEGKPAKVFEVEPLGGHTVVTLDAGQSRFRALLRGQPDIRTDALVAVSCEPARVHYFSAAGRALARGAAPT
jgi:multiple sugar transport system ATP-binding protein